jgi:hypothetical protein
VSGLNSKIQILWVGVDGGDYVLAFLVDHAVAFNGGLYNGSSYFK